MERNIDSMALISHLQSSSLDLAFGSELGLIHFNLVYPHFILLEKANWVLCKENVFKVL